MFSSQSLGVQCLEPRGEVWRPQNARPEEKLLKIVTDKNINGVNHLFGLGELDGTSKLYEELQFGNPRRLRTAAAGHSNPRCFTSVVVCPYGRQLEEYRSVVELLTVVRDAIKAHQSLYKDAKILHQDVSVNNILISTGKINGQQPQGMLIDLDAALELDFGPMNPNELIGTRPFMAIGLLQGQPHTYRHDLESFLYVLLWAAICGDKDEPPEASRLQRWPSGRFVDCARNKLYDMGEEGFAKLIAELPQELEGIEQVLQDLRQALFMVQNGSISTSTDLREEGVDGLYGRMLYIFDVAIAERVGK
ncbi:hypothetical protein TOPH_07966 [Tolypocladium ophioglossoides CBS 100239]|uniref:EKC/KEOPS complex subunit BUD32 n=1 Tax=Tolypocladium ophioglossoides (strain CBS 100239) TaxID=1163406 RepID=A0A0L0MZX3_TOLOC|nr:hypothetical protein TOPH_07966 [Tolypocladium ophioglossoides CBS 100239]